MYVIYPAEEVVYLTYSSHSSTRPRPRPTLDVLTGDIVQPPPVPSSRPPLPLKLEIPPKTAPPEIEEYTPASPTLSLERPSKQKAKASKLLRKLGRHDDLQFGKIVRTPCAEEFELPAPLPTPAFSRKNIFDRDFDALFEVASTPQFSATIRVNTPEPDRKSDVSAIHFPSPTASQYSLFPPRPNSEPSAPSTRTSSPLPPPSPSPQRLSFEGSLPKPKKVSFLRRFSRSKASASSKMQQQSQELVLQELTHPAHNDALKNQQNVTFKLAKTISDFTSQLSQLYDRHSSELQVLVSNFRKRNSELWKERNNKEGEVEEEMAQQHNNMISAISPLNNEEDEVEEEMARQHMLSAISPLSSCPSSLFHTWETLLQEVEADVNAYHNAATAFDRDVAAPLVDRTFHMKTQSRELFAQREGCEIILAKADEQLNKSRREYLATFLNYSNNPTPAELAAYYDFHNNYVQQLTATNAMLEQYYQHTLPTILQELEEILHDVTSVIGDSISKNGEIMTEKSNNQLRRFESLAVQSKAISSTADLAHFARSVLIAQPAGKPVRRSFLPPYPPEPDDPPMNVSAESMPPVLKEEMLLDRMGGGQARMTYEHLKSDSLDLEQQIKQLQDSLEALSRAQARSLENNVLSKVNDLQEEISMKKYDYRATQLHLASVRAQRDLFASKADSMPSTSDRKLSSSSTGSMKNKWLKAFRTLKPSSSPSNNSSAQYER